MKKVFSIFLSLLIFSGCLSGCSRSSKNQNDEPLTLTIWHVYGGQTSSPLNDMIDEFNDTVGREQGIRVEVTMVSNTNAIHKDVIASANRDPGAPELPDLFTSYPKTILAMPDDTILCDFRDFFSEEELSAYIPAFLEEGQIHNRQLIFPVAKSTEVMFINETIFNRFAGDAGVTLEDLDTWEGLYETAEKYVCWSNEHTTDIRSNAHTFLVHDYHFDYFQVGTQSLGEKFFDGDKILFSDTIRKIWEPYAKAALNGGIWLRSGYATEPLRTGDAVVSVGSSASVLYYSDIVTYADNTSENVRFAVRPCPVFRDGKKLVMQRGAGMCLVHSTPEREKAAAVFLKWLTKPDNNSHFVTRAGYMPVTEKAFTDHMKQEIASLTDPKYISLYQAYMETFENYEFYNAPQFPAYLSLETAFEENIRTHLLKCGKTFQQLPPDQQDIGQAISQSCSQFFNIFVP